MKNGQQQLALRRVTSFQIKSGDTEQVDVIYESDRSVATIRQGQAHIVLTMAEAPLLIEALEHIVGDAPETDAPAPQARKRTDVAGQILKFVQHNEVSVANEAAILMSALDLSRAQVTAALPRMKRAGRLLEYQGALKRPEDMPREGLV